MALNGRNHSDYGVAEDYFPITPNDASDLTVAVRAVMVTVGGNLTLTRTDGTVVTLTVPAGLLPVRAVRIWSTNTTATGLTGLV